jgi:hypothetical protein
MLRCNPSVCASVQPPFRHGQGSLHSLPPRRKQLEYRSATNDNDDAHGRLIDLPTKAQSASQALMAQERTTRRPATAPFGNITRVQVSGSAGSQHYDRSHIARILTSYPELVSSDQCQNYLLLSKLYRES